MLEEHQPPTMLSDVLRKHNCGSLINSPSSGRSKPCLAHLKDNGEAETFLTFSQAQIALQQHHLWLQETVDSAFKPPSFSMKSEPIAVAYLSGNSADFFLSVLAASDLSFAIPALLNTRWTFHEIANVLNSESKKKKKKKQQLEGNRTLLMYGPSFRELSLEVVRQLQQQQPDANVCCKPIPEFSSFLLVSSAPDPSSYSLRNTLCCSNANPSETIRSLAALQKTKHHMEAELILFTSGTTSGGAKGVRLRHSSLLIQALAKLGSPCHISSTTRALASTLPFFHVGGLTNLLAVWLAGGTLLLPSPSPSSQTFDPHFVWSAVLPFSSTTTWTCNTLVVVPAMLHMLQNAIQQSSQGRTEASPVASHVQLVLIGGQSASTEILAFLRGTFPRARLVQTFACTEAASSLTFHNVATAHQQQSTTRSNPKETTTTPGVVVGDCVGTPPPHVQITLFRFDNNDHNKATQRVEIKAPYQVGLIATRGPHVMNGYWKRGDIVDEDDDTHPTKWFVTNDLGAWDQKGNILFCGRASDSIRTGGETVMALEVERTILPHPQIKEVAVFAVPSAQFGEQVACAVVLAGNGTSTATELLDEIRIWCKTHGLSGYKCPRSLLILDDLPRNSGGKVLKHQLQELYMRKHAPSKL